MKFIYKAAALTCLVLVFFISGCNDRSEVIEKKKKILIMATTADYPPFEFIKDKKIKGFDIDLAYILAKKLGYSLYIKDMNFDSIIAALQTHQVDFAMAALTRAPERENRIDFSTQYYVPTYAMLYIKGQSPITKIEELKNKTIGVQLGTTMESFLKEQVGHVENLNIISLTRIPSMVQDLRLKRLNGVMIEDAQAKVFIGKYPELDYGLFANAGEGYSVAFPKNSPLKEQFDSAIIKLRDSGELDELKKKWLF